MKKLNERTHGEQTFDTELQSKAKVEHHVIESTPEMDSLREVLADMGKDLQKIRVAPETMQYMGSFSVHCYASEGLKGTFAFVSVQNPHKCFYKLAEAAGKKLMGDIQQTFTGRFQKKRSGFANG
jgi:hypothetical protein